MRIKSCLDQESASEIRDLLHLFWLGEVNYCPSGYHGSKNSHSLDGLLVYLDAKKLAKEQHLIPEQMKTLVHPFYDSPYYYAAAKWGLDSNEACSLFQKQIPLRVLFKRAELLIKKHGLVFLPLNCSSSSQ